MPKVGIVMGSDSDMKVMSKAADMLEKFGVEYEMTIISAHRERMFFMTMRNQQKRKILKSSLREQGWRRIFRECVRRFSRCR